jgi:conjugal transfer pilus assembly protein TraE
VLRYVIPESYGAMTEQLIREEERLKKDQVSVHFHPIEVRVYPDTLSTEVTGDLLSYVSDKKVTDQRETYRFQFQNRGGKLMIESFTLQKTDRPKDASS